MRALFLLYSTLIGACLLGAQQPPGNCPPDLADPYRVAFVNSAFHFFRDANGGFEGEAKRFVYPTPSLPELGDSVSIAILKILKPGELAEPGNAKAYLTLVNLAFSYRNRVSQESDRTPNITLLLLNYLGQKELVDPELEKRIDSIKICVQDFTCHSSNINR